MSTPALTLVAPDIVERLMQAGEDARRRAVKASCDLAVERAGLSDDRVSQARFALASGVVGDVPARRAIQVLTEELDNDAWDIQDRVEAGAASQGDYLRAFAKARAAAAVGYAFEPDSLNAAMQALYEAHYAIQDLALLRAAVNDAME